MHRVEVFLKQYLPDPRGISLVRDIHDLGIRTVSDVRVVDIYWLDADLTLDKLDLICRILSAIFGAPSTPGGHGLEPRNMATAFRFS